MLVAFLVAGAAGVVNDDVILRPLRPAGALTTAIGAVALTIVLENIVRFIFGNDLRGYDLPIRRDWQWGALRIGPQQVENLVIAVIAMTAVFLFLAGTRTGKAMRAVADDPDAGQPQGHRPRTRGPPHELRRHGPGRHRRACCWASTRASIPSPASA